MEKMKYCQDASRTRAGPWHCGNATTKFDGTVFCQERLKITATSDVPVRVITTLSVCSVGVLLLAILAYRQRQKAVVVVCKRRVLRFDTLRTHSSLITDNRHEVPLAIVTDGSYLCDENVLREYIQEKITW